MNRRRITFLLIILIGLIGSFILLRPAAGESGRIQAQLQLPDTDLSGFKRVTGPEPIIFPRDNGPHDDYLTEWWYYTGNLRHSSGRHFGFQLTFFRRALSPNPLDLEGSDSSEWRSRQAYSVHFAITDVRGGDFFFTEEFSRGAAGLAGAQADPYRVWLNQYQVLEQTDGTYLLEAASGDYSLQLTLKDAKGPVLHGIDGFSQKGAAPGNASVYISQTRLESRGSVTIAGDRYQVEGLSWMDHEFSTSVLASNQVGWDWFSLQLSDGTELMVFQLRNDDGGIDPFSSGTLIGADGATRNLSRDQFSITVLDSWTSPNTSTEYPARWLIEVQSEGLQLELQPHLPDQELRVSVIYWEGAVTVDGDKNGVPVTGNGYAELTGYREPISGQF